jgi:hypothetical protein
VIEPADPSRLLHRDDAGSFGSPAARKLERPLLGGRELFVVLTRGGHVSTPVRGPGSLINGFPAAPVGVGASV